MHINRVLLSNHLSSEDITYLPDSLIGLALIIKKELVSFCKPVILLDLAKKIHLGIKMENEKMSAKANGGKRNAWP